MDARWEKRQAELAREQAERESELAARRQEADEKKEAEQQEIIARKERFRLDHEARKLLNSEITRERTFDLPDASWTAEDFIEESDEPLHPIIEGLHYDGNNTLLVAEHKTGKTTLEINLTAALVDGKPFLGRYATAMSRGKVAFFNYEMSSNQFRHWLNDADIENIDRVVPLNLRGYKMPFWDETELLRLAEFLNKSEVQFIIMDPASKAWRGLVENESDNIELAEFFGAIDLLKSESGVPNLMLAVHTPRDADRARGGGEIEAWPDANWYLSKTKTSGTRMLRAEGRDVFLSEVALRFDAESRGLEAIEGGAKQARLEAGVEAAVLVCKEAGGFPSLKAFANALKGQPGNSREAIKEAISQGLVGEKEGSYFVSD